MPKLLISVAIVLATPSAAWAWANYSYWNGSTGSEHWFPHNGTCEMLIAGGANGSPLLAWVQTDKWSGPSSCNPVRSYINGDLFGIDWHADTYWQSGTSYTAYWGNCDWNRHYSKKNGAVWTRTKNC